MRDALDWVGALFGIIMIAALIALPFTVAKAVYITDYASIRNAIYNLFLSFYSSEMAKCILSGSNAVKEK